MSPARSRPWSVALALALLPATAAAGQPPLRLSLRPAEGPATATARADGDRLTLQYPPPQGLPMLITGVSLFLLGIPTTIVGAFVARSPEDIPGLRLEADRISRHAGLSFLIPGAAMLFVGATMMAAGAVRYERFRRWQTGRVRSVAPITGRTPAGTWTAGVHVRF